MRTPSIAICSLVLISFPALAGITVVGQEIRQGISRVGSGRTKRNSFKTRGKSASRATPRNPDLLLDISRY